MRCVCLRRQPSFSLFVVLTLAIGIGANSAVFSVVNGVVLRPLPFEESDRLVAIWGRFDPESGFDFPQFSSVESRVRRLQEQLASCRRDGGVSAAIGDRWRPGSRSRARAERGGDPHSVSAVAGAAGTRSRVHRAGRQPVRCPRRGAVAWLLAALGSAAILRCIGRVIPMNGMPTQVIGVMPAGRSHIHGRTPHLWVPLRIDPANPGNRQGAQHARDRTARAGRRARDRPRGAAVADDRLEGAHSRTSTPDITCSSVRCSRMSPARFVRRCSCCSPRPASSC